MCSMTIITKYACNTQPELRAWFPNGPQPDQEVEFDGHHREASKMFKLDLGSGHSASDLLFFRLHSFLDSR